MIPMIDFPSTMNHSSSQRKKRSSEDYQQLIKAKRKEVHEDVEDDDDDDNDDDEDDDDDDDDEDDDDEDDNNNDDDESQVNVVQDIDSHKKGHRQPVGDCLMPRLIEKSVIVHKDENGFGLRFKGQCPIYVEHVHENGAAWRAGVRPSDTVSKVNGIPISQLSHKDIILMFKSCTRFVAITLLSSQTHLEEQQRQPTSVKLHQTNHYLCSRQASTYSHRSCISALNNYENQTNPPNNGRRLQFDRTSSCRTTMTAKTLNNHHRLTIPAPNGHRGGFFAGESQSNKSALSSIELMNGVQYNEKRIPLVAKVERRDSMDSIEAEIGPGGDERMAVCVFCRNSIDNKTSRAINTNNTRALDITCSQCQLRYDLVQSSLDNAAKRNEQVANNIHGMNDEHQNANKRNDSIERNERPQAKQSISQSNASLRQQQKSRFIYKLSQSASTSSLPLDGAAASASASAAAAAAAVSANKLKATALSKLELTNHLNDNKLARPAKLVINKRVEIIREFIETEKTHTERLRCLDELFYRPLKAGGLMSGEQLRSVFSCHRTLYKIHRQIYRTLLSANYGHLYGSEPLIGSALLEIFEGKLKKRLERAANSFCSAQATNIELLNKLTRRDTKVGDFLAHVTSQQMVGRLGIKDLLASCFQRLTKYPLLLENLLKATPQTPHDDDDDDDGDNDDNENHSMDLMVSRGTKLISSHSSDIDYYQADKDRGELEEDEAEEEEARSRQLAEEQARRLNSKRMLAISLAEEREFIERALQQSRQILVQVNEAIRVAVSRHKLKEIWKRTDKYPGVPLIDITKQQVVHEGLLTLRLSKRSFDVYVLLLNDYLIILTREGQDKYRLKFFTPDGKYSTLPVGATSGGSAGGGNGGGSLVGPAAATQTVTGATSSSVYSPVFVIDEHLTTRDAATDENGFYLLCKRKDDSRIYEFASRSPAERIKWRESIQWTIDRQMSRNNSTRRVSCSSITMTKSNSQDVSTNLAANKVDETEPTDSNSAAQATSSTLSQQDQPDNSSKTTQRPNNNEPTKFVGTISYVEDDEIVPPSEMELLSIQVDQAIQVNVFETTSSCATNEKPATVVHMA